MKNLQTLFSLGVIVAIVSIFFAPDIFAASSITLPTGTGLSSKGIDVVLTDVLKWFLGLLGVLAMLMIVVSGIMYITSGGDDGRVEKAKSMLTYSIIGLVVALLSYAIVKVISEKL